MLKAITGKHSTKLYTIVRADLHSEAYQLPQSIHAIADFIISHPITSYKWNKNSNVMVSLSIPTLPDLHKLASELRSRKIPYTLFYEPAIKAHTAIATTDAAAPVLSGLPLALKKKRDVLLVQHTGF